MSFYSKLETQYKTVPDDGRIDTLNFLEASRVSIIPLLDILGPTAFAFVKSDVNGNITKLLKKYEEDKVKFVTLTAMVDREREQDECTKLNSATDALIWLTRGLHFICLFIKNIIDGKNKEEDISPCITEAYEQSLKRHHNWVVQKAVSLAFMAVPYYSDLVKALQGDSDRDTLQKDLERYYGLLNENVKAVQDIYVARNLNPRPLMS